MGSPLFLLFFCVVGYSPNWGKWPRYIDREICFFIAFDSNMTWAPTKHDLLFLYIASTFSRKFSNITLERLEPGYAQELIQ